VNANDEVAGGGVGELVAREVPDEGVARGEAASHLAAVTARAERDRHVG
jgi:hypothetical protein